MQKKFLRTLVIFGSVFALKLLDPTSSVYGMDDDGELETVTSHYSYDTEDTRREHMKHFRTTERDCPHKKDWRVKSVHEFKVDDYAAEDKLLTSHYCNPCWKKYWEDTCGRLQRQRNNI